MIAIRKTINQRNRLSWLLLATFILSVIFVFAYYRSYLCRGFYTEDFYWLTGNPALTWRQFTNDWIPLPVGYYRPVYRIYFSAMTLLFGRQPVAFHTVGLGMHVANIVLLVALVQRLTRNMLGASLSGLIYALYPGYDYALWWISSQSVVMATMLSLLSLHAWVTFRNRSQARWLALSLGSCALAMTTKEDALVLPIVLAALDRIVCRPTRNFDAQSPNAWMPRALIGVVFAGVIALNPHAQSFFYGMAAHKPLNATEFPTTDSHGTRVQIALSTLMHIRHYLTLLFCGVLPLSVPGVGLIISAAIAGAAWPYLSRQPVLVWSGGVTLLSSLPVPIAVPGVLEGSWYYYLPALFLSLFLGGLTAAVLADLRVDAFRERSRSVIALTVAVASSIFPLFLDFFIATVFVIVLCAACYVLVRLDRLPLDLGLIVSLAALAGISRQLALIDVPDWILLSILGAVGAVVTRRSGWWMGALLMLMVGLVPGLIVFLAAYVVLHVPPPQFAKPRSSSDAILPGSTSLN